MKYNKNADTLLFLLLFSESQREKKWKNISCECRRSEKVKNGRFWVQFITISTEFQK